MSYARFGHGVSDVYVYWHYQGGVECCACLLEATPTEPYAFVNLPPLQMLRHLKRHRAAGHTVPDYTFAGIFRDRHELGIR